MVWNSLLYYSPTNMTGRADTAVTGRSSDYRAPDTLVIGTGTAWSDADENTASDNYNEAEGAYLMEMNPAGGLAFRLTGGSGSPPTRYKPFFKIRRWQSLATPGLTLNATPLTRDAQYKADVKPLSRAHQANSIVYHSTLESAAATSTTIDIGPTSGFGNALWTGARYGSGAGFTSTFAQVVAPIGNAGGLERLRRRRRVLVPAVQRRRLGIPRDPRLLVCVVGHQSCMVFEQYAGDLYFRASSSSSTCAAGAGTQEVRVWSGSYSWRGDDWVHLRIDWAATRNKMRILVNGVSVGESPFSALTSPSGTVNSYVGSCSVSCPAPGSTGHADGAIDEFYIYAGPGAGVRGETQTPSVTPGLTGVRDSSGWAIDALADSSTDLSLNLTPADANYRRGYYLTFGSDSKFRGLNISLAQAGAGNCRPAVAVLAGDTVGQHGRPARQQPQLRVHRYHERSHEERERLLVRPAHVGRVSGRPGSWKPYSINGGPDLYYVRVFLPANFGSYSTAPKEARYGPTSCWSSTARPEHHRELPDPGAGDDGR